MENKYNDNLDKESIYLLQLLDCNCNNCIHMERDMLTYNKWQDIEKERQLTEYENKRTAASQAIANCKDEAGKKTLLHIFNKMKFMFDRQYLLNYGNCKKINNAVSFIPNICQLETQHCFEHRNIK